ncbi:MAG: VWA domain-containing protein [Gemmataceae bacterium]|nr:VWA domain-containing protein [Gemmataceae bacterium]
MLGDYWIAYLSLLLALAMGALALVLRQTRGTWDWRGYLPVPLLASFGLGAFHLIDEPWVAGGIAIGAGSILLLLLVAVVINGFWNVYLGYGLACVLFFGLGAVLGNLLQENLREVWILLTSLRVQSPWWLMLLAAIPLLIWTSWRALIGLGNTRRWLVLVFRSALILFVVLALAEVFARRPNDHVTVMFVWDRSLSVPPEIVAGEDVREKRLYAFINDSVSKRGTQHASDRVGVVVFGKHPRMELPPSAVPKLGFHKILSQIDNTYTDVAGAMKLALASFPEGSGKRMVLISDGNENIGQAEEQARLAKQNGVQVDVVKIDAARRQVNEILVERIEAPAVTEKNTRLPMRVVIRSFNPKVVVAQLNLRKISFDPSHELQMDEKERKKNSSTVRLHQGLNVCYFQQAGSKDDTVFAYEASVVPLRVETSEGALVERGLPGDRVDNNIARVCVLSRGEKAVLLLESEKDRHQLLVSWLKKMHKGLKVVSLTINPRDEKDPVNKLHELTKGDNERLATFLSRFDAVILANLPADSLTEDEQKVIRSHVHDQGAGLLMIGGNQSFGAGGWQNTEIEKALPVNCELKAMKVEGKSGLVLIMHASEMAEGNAWQRKIAKLAIEKLSAMDMVGQIHYNHGLPGGHQWHIPFQDVGADRKEMLNRVNTMEPGDMPDVDPAFELALKALANEEYQLGTKHIILISDGDHWDSSIQMLNRLKKAKISCTTVCITTHGKAEIDKLSAVAKYLRGRFYHIKDPKELPAIYIKETRLVSQSFVHEGAFMPLLRGVREGPTEGLTKLPDLYGFVRTTARESNLVKVMIQTPEMGTEKYVFPILAAWQYGLGKGVAFTSDARTHPGEKPFWDRDWANSEVYGKYWDQTVNWMLRPNETGKHLFMSTEQKDGKIRITLEAQDADKSPITDVELKAGITTPAFKVKDDRKFELKFEQKNAGVYEAEIPADEVGAYFINIQAKWNKEVMKDGKKVLEPMTDVIRAGVSIPYSPEFAEMESNPDLLDRIAYLTDGKVYSDDDASLQVAAARSDVFRNVPDSHANLQALWAWMVFLAAFCLLFDVALRRIAIEPEAVWAKAVGYWQHLRGQAKADDSAPAYIERLKSRKAQVSESIDKQKAGKKFESDGKTPATPTITSTSAPVEKPKAKPAAEKSKQEDAADFATRLMRAKKKAMEERDKERGGNA